MASRAAARWLATAALVTPVQRWLVLTHAVPYGQPWRTGCQECGAALAPAGGGAAPESSGRSPLWPAGRCGGCRRRIGAPPYLLELTTLLAAAMVTVAVAGGRWPWPAAVALAGFAAAAVPLTFIDLAVHRLPDRLTLPAAGWVLGWLGVATALGTGGGWLRALAAAAVCGLGFAAITLIFGDRGFGLGDAKLAVSVGGLLGWLGWTALVAGLLLAFLASGLVATGLLIARRVSRRDALPFGPFLVAGGLLAVAWVGLSG